MANIDNRDLPLIMLLAEANSTPSGWQNFLDSLITHFNLYCCNLYLLNPMSQGIRFQEWSGARPSDIQLNDYMMNYFHSDTTHSLMFSGASGTWLTPNLRDDRAELESTAAYQEWAKPNNYIYSTATTLFKEPNAICALHFSRGRNHQPFTQEEEDRFTALTPYIEKAIRVRLKLARNIDNNRLLLHAINTFKIPIAILNEFAEIVAINSLMEDVLVESSGLYQSENTLHGKQQETDFNLQLSIADAISRAKGKPLDYEPKEIHLKMDQGIHKLGVCELSETSESKAELFLGAMIYIVPNHIERCIKKHQLKSLFNLTESEATVCEQFMHNKSIKQIAQVEGKSANTVREQLQNCYIKAGVSNQLELINLLGSIPTHC